MNRLTWIWLTIAFTWIAVAVQWVYFPGSTVRWAYDCPKEREAAIYLAKNYPEVANMDYPAKAKEDAACHLTEAVRTASARPFLPDYLRLIRGENINPDTCEAHDLHDLMLGCDHR